MSHSIGAVKFKDGEVKFYEYNGTVDVPISHIYDTVDEVNENWRNHEWVNCTCGKEEPVSIFSDYGGGFYFDGLACKNCKSVCTPGDFNIIEREHTDDWAKNIFEND